MSRSYAAPVVPPASHTGDGIAEAYTRRTSRRPYVVVGLGNEIVHDDGVGIRTAWEVRRRLQGRGDVDVIPLPWAGFALLDVLRDRRCAAIVDCLCGGVHPPGTVIRLDERELGGAVRLNSFHDLSYPSALALGRRMGWALPQRIAIWGVEGCNVHEFGVGLTPAVAGAVDRVVDEVLAFLPQPYMPTRHEIPRRLSGAA